MEQDKSKLTSETILEPNSSSIESERAKHTQIQAETVRPAKKLAAIGSVLSKYNVAGPRYTSYPTALEFNEDFDRQTYLACLDELDEDSPLSLYIHVPFCQNICYYCACNKVITKDFSKSNEYVANLIKEIQLVAEKVGNKSVAEVHWGGGTPTFLTVEQIQEVMQAINKSFGQPNGFKQEFAIEVDPRSIELSDVKKLAGIGFNRMSIGVQDFNFKVQKAINRVQPFEMVDELIREARLNHFESINIDLIYGLPYQTVDSYKQTLKQVSKLSPDRISVFNYAHLPHRFKPQRRINTATLPTPEGKIAIFSEIIDSLQADGYLYIGMDHFAKPNDELAIAQKNKTLHRNFQGYTTHSEYALIGLGVSAISSFNGHYHQNVKTIDEYYRDLAENRLPTWRGITVDEDDRLRKQVIFELICHFSLDFRTIESRFAIDFKKYFSEELASLQPFIKDRLVVVDNSGIQVSTQGRLLIRNICMTFDKYLNGLKNEAHFSKVI